MINYIIRKEIDKYIVILININNFYQNNHSYNEKTNKKNIKIQEPRQNIIISINIKVYIKFSVSIILLINFYFNYKTYLVIISSF